MDIIKSVSRTTKEFYKIDLDSYAIVKLLREAGHNVPDDAVVTFTVPTGGDYSGDVLDVDADCPVTVSWTTITQD